MEHVYREGVPQESENQGGVKFFRFKGGGSNMSVLRGLVKWDNFNFNNPGLWTQNNSGLWTCNNLD